MLGLEGITRPHGFRLPSHLRPNLSSVPAIAAACDGLAVLIGSAIAGAAYHELAFGQVGNPHQYISMGLIFAATTVVLGKLNNLYTPTRVLSRRVPVASFLMIWVGVVTFLLGLFFVLKISDQFSRGWILSLAVIGPCLLLVQRYLLSRALLALSENRTLNHPKIILINGDTNARAAFADLFPLHEVEQAYSLPPDPEAIKPFVKSVADSVRGRHVVSELYIALDWSRWSDIEQVVGELRTLPLPVKLIADNAAREILRHPCFEVQRAPLTSSERAVKRAFDLILASVGLVVLAPLILVVAVALWAESGSPILFRQARGGFNGRSFNILKFRTMRVMENGPSIIQATSNDRRVTKIGRLLRRSSIDELPQLINVLRGEMSLVGPRPHALAHDCEYASLISAYPCRHHVKPGITGWAQVNGLRGETPSLTLMKQRVDLDLWYVTNWSLWLDIEILLRTTFEICRARNAF